MDGRGRWRLGRSLKTERRKGLKLVLRGSPPNIRSKELPSHKHDWKENSADKARNGESASFDRLHVVDWMKYAQYQDPTVCG